MEALRVHVERIVRPIRAYGGRKNKMREELLAHLEQRVQTAREVGKSEADGVAIAIESLGNADELRAELQGSVPVLERFSFVGLGIPVLDAWFHKDDTESAMRFAGTRTAYTVFMLVGLFFPVVVATDGTNWLKIATGQQTWDWESAWTVKHCYQPLLLLFGAAVATFLAYYLADISSLRRNLSNRVRRSLLVRTASLQAFIGGYSFLIASMSIGAVYLSRFPRTSTLLPPMPDSFSVWVLLAWIVLPFVLFLLAGLPFVAWIVNQEQKHYERWGGLRFD